MPRLVVKSLLAVYRFNAPFDIRPRVPGPPPQACMVESTTRLKKNLSTWVIPKRTSCRDHWTYDPHSPIAMLSEGVSFNLSPSCPLRSAMPSTLHRGVRGSARLCFRCHSLLKFFFRRVGELNKVSLDTYSQCNAM